MKLHNLVLISAATSLIVFAPACGPGVKATKEQTPGLVKDSTPETPAKITQSAILFDHGTIVSYAKIAQPQDAPCGLPFGKDFSVKYDSLTKEYAISGIWYGKCMNWKLFFVKAWDRNRAIYGDSLWTLSGERETKGARHFYYVTDSLIQKGRLIFQTDSDCQNGKTEDRKGEIWGLYRYQIDSLTINLHAP